MSGPRLLRVLARFLIPARDREFIIGDLDELYARRLREEGRATASLRYVQGVFASAVARRFGRGPGPRSRRPAEAKRGGTLGGATADLRQAVRSIRRNPAFTFLVVVIVALGVGPAAAVFGMANQLLLRPLPGVANTSAAAYLQFLSAPDPPQRALMLRAGFDSLETQDRPTGISLPDFDALRDGATLLDGMASYGSIDMNVAVGDARPVQVRGHTVHGDFFEVLGVAPAAGRLLTAADTGVESEPLVTVISERLRDRLFGPGEDIVGRTISVGRLGPEERQSVTVVGVTGGGFLGPERGTEIDAWFPLSALVPLAGVTSEGLRSRESARHENLLVLTREGVTPEAAEAQIARILARLGQASSGSAQLAELRPRVLGGLHAPPSIRERMSSILRLMAWAVGLILAIACANVANLLLFRNLARRGALAARRALGASSGRIARQHIMESLILGALGTVAGIGVAWLIALPFRGEEVLRMPAFEGFTMDWEVVAFVTAIAVATALLFGVLPATLAGRFDLGTELRASQAQDTGRVGSLRSSLSVGQIGLTLTLLVGGLLMARTIANLYGVDTGLDIEGVARMYIVPRTDLEADELRASQQPLLDAMVRLPEVTAAALDVYGPHWSMYYGELSRMGAPETEEIMALMWPVTPGWFELFGVEVINGRTFRDSDWGSSSETGIVLTSSLARRLFGRTDVAGQTLRAGPRGLEARRVLGVVEDYRSAMSLSEPTDAFFVTYESAPPLGMTLLVRTSSFNSEVANRIKDAAESVLPGVSVPDPNLLSERVDAIHQEERILGRLLWILSVFGVLMSGVGLYGVVAFLVSHRQRELGIRLALGADRARILELVLHSGLSIVALGTLLGLLGAYGLSRLLESRLFGVEPFDLTSYAGAAGLLAVVAVLACMAPARAAISVDPIETLRQE